VKVVSDASALIALVRADCLKWLPKLYRSILIPMAVYEEVSGAKSLDDLNRAIATPKKAANQFILSAGV
jgi:predicted nucleic acid-binding protein